MNNNKNNSTKSLNKMSLVAIINALYQKEDATQEEILNAVYKYQKENAHV